MDLINTSTDVGSSPDKHQDRRMLGDRRVSHGRRSMIRFDKNGGDRRSGYARRRTDVGFRKQTEDE